SLIVLMQSKTIEGRMSSVAMVLRRCPPRNGNCGSPADIRRRPIGGAAGDSIFGAFILVIRGNGLPDESSSIVETVGVNDRAGTSRRFAHGADKIGRASCRERVEVSVVGG